MSLTSRRTVMARKRYKPEEIVAKLRQVDVLVSQGQAMADAIRQIGVSEVTYYRWRQEFGGQPGWIRSHTTHEEQNVAALDQIECDRRTAAVVLLFSQLLRWQSPDSRVLGQARTAPMCTFASSP